VKTELLGDIARLRTEKTKLEEVETGKRIAGIDNTWAASNNSSLATRPFGVTPLDSAAPKLVNQSHLNIRNNSVPLGLQLKGMKNFSWNVDDPGPVPWQQAVGTAEPNFTLPHCGQIRSMTTDSVAERSTYLSQQSNQEICRANDLAVLSDRPTKANNNENSMNFSKNIGESLDLAASLNCNLQESQNNSVPPKLSTAILSHHNGVTWLVLGHGRTKFSSLPLWLM